MFLDSFNPVTSNAVRGVIPILFICDAHVNSLVEINQHIPFITPFRHCMQSMIEKLLVESKMM